VRRLVFLVSAGAIFLAAAPSAFACGTAGYSYAGISSRTPVYGVGATVTALAAPAVQNGHVAGWVGVGGPGLGPNGEDEWLQVGLATFAGSAEGHLYYELAQPSREPQYTELASGIQPGEKQRVALLELPFAHDSWVVVSSAGIAGPFYLPRSHRAWEPIATAESYSDGATCNRYAYRFGGVQLAHANGSWHELRHGRELQDPGFSLRRHGASTFSASTA